MQISTQSCQLVLNLSCAQFIQISTQSIQISIQSVWISTQSCRLVFDLYRSVLNLVD